MADVIKIKKGLNINLKGKAEKVCVKADLPDTFAVKPTDFHGLVPKLLVQLGDKVTIGTALFFDKANPDIKFTSPVSGEISSINRGERRRILEVVIKSDGKEEKEDFGKANPSDLSAGEITSKLLHSGLWPCIMQRPYNVIAKPGETPKAIYISAFDTAPLAPDYDFILSDYEKEFQRGIDALKKLTSGTIHLNVNSEYTPTPAIANVQGVQFNYFKGIHPAGNVGTQIHHIDPINKGDLIWVVNPQDVVSIGKLFIDGVYDPSRIVALTGSEILKPKYYKTIRGASIIPLTKGNEAEGELRHISGNVLTGSRISSEGYLGYYDSQITVIPEGNFYEFFGWALPGLNKFSQSRSYFSWLMPKKEFTVDTNIHGGERALMITGSFEKVFPMDIYPMQLIKAVIAEDIDLMEKLGIYEVAEEDFALCEFVDTSKTNIQEIIRNGLDLMLKEMS